jgi:inosine/xanthosine triphosphatase
MSDSETRRGAGNRAQTAQSAEPNADYWIGIEGGVEDKNGSLEAFAWVVIISPVRMGSGRTGAYFLPQETTQLIRQGYELGDADDMVFGRSNSKQQNGSVGILTHDVIDRTAYYVHAVILALIPFVNLQLTFSNLNDI